MGKGGRALACIPGAWLSCLSFELLARADSPAKFAAADAIIRNSTFLADCPRQRNALPVPVPPCLHSLCRLRWARAAAAVLAYKRACAPGRGGADVGVAPDMAVEPPPVPQGVRLARGRGPEHAGKQHSLGRCTCMQPAPPVLYIVTPHGR